MPTRGFKNGDIKYVKIKNKYGNIKIGMENKWNYRVAVISANAANASP